LLGNVTDATGAVVPGATVTILHKETSQTRRTTTNDNGDTVSLPFPPNVIGDPSLAGRSMDLWFNTSAFTVPVLSFGAAGRGLIRNPNFYNSDISLFKNIPVKEKFTLQVRGEFFNAFNIINPGNANGNASTGNQNFGRITSISGSPRDIQLAMKLSF